MLNRLLHSKFNYPRRAYRKLIRFLALRLGSYEIPADDQTGLFAQLGLDRQRGLELLDEALQSVLQIQFNENDGMFSEHLVLLAAIAASDEKITNILEIGTFDGRTALILSRLFPNANILTIDLPATDDEFKSTYDRNTNAQAFSTQRNAYLDKCNRIEFREMNSIALSQETGGFDLIWIDGAHGYPVVAMDIINAFRLCNDGGFALIDDVWTSTDFSDRYYKSTGALECMLELKNAGLISGFTLVPKRLGASFNLPREKKFVGYIRKIMDESSK